MEHPLQSACLSLLFSRNGLSQDSTKNPECYFQKQTQKIELHFKTPSTPSTPSNLNSFLNWAEVVLGYKSLLNNKQHQTKKYYQSGPFQLSLSNKLHCTFRVYNIIVSFLYRKKKTNNIIQNSYRDMLQGMLRVNTI